MFRIIRKEMIPLALLIAAAVFALGFGVSHFVTTPDNQKKPEVRLIKSGNFDPGEDFINRGLDP